MRFANKHFCYLIIVLLPLLCSNCSTTTEEPAYIYTVCGKLSVKEMGMTLSHEHIAVDFIGAEKVEKSQYDEDYAIETVLPHLIALKDKGIKTIFECTPEYIGRDVRLLKRLSELSGLNIITNTGYYAAVDRKYLPAHVYNESIEDIAERWEREWEEGIGGTGIKPGFIKLGVGKGELDSIETKLLKAAVIVSKKSGLTIAMHTGNGEAAYSEYKIIEEGGLKAEKMIWVHAQNGTDEERKNLARKGVWISLDNINETQIDEYLDRMKFMKENNLLSKVLISHDDGWSVVNNDGKVELELFEFGNSRPYNTIFSIFIEELYKIGFTQDDLDMILIDNPGKALAIG